MFIIDSISFFQCQFQWKSLIENRHLILSVIIIIPCSQSDFISDDSKEKSDLSLPVIKSPQEIPLLLHWRAAMEIRFQMCRICMDTHKFLLKKTSIFEQSSYCLRSNHSCFTRTSIWNQFFQILFWHLLLFQNILFYQAVLPADKNRIKASSSDLNLHDMPHR